MTQHKVGDLVCDWDLKSIIEFGVIVNITEDAFLPYTVQWFESGFRVHYDDKKIRVYKKNFNKLGKQHDSSKSS